MALKPVVGYTHTQAGESTTWTVNHGLNCYPTVDTYVYIDGVLTKIIPKEINLVDKNTLQILFSQARSGLARLI